MSTAIYYSTHNNMHTNDDITNGSGSTTSGNPGANPSNPNHTNAGATINNNSNIGLNSANKNHTTLLPSLAHIMPSNSNNTTNSGSSIDISSTLINPYSSGPLPLLQLVVVMVDIIILHHHILNNNNNNNNLILLIRIKLLQLQLIPISIMILHIHLQIF